MVPLQISMRTATLETASRLRSKATVAWEPSATSSSTNDEWAKRLPEGPKLGVLVLALLLAVLERRMRVLGSIAGGVQGEPAGRDLGSAERGERNREREDGQRRRNE
jgi:hypothetical protein